MRIEEYIIKENLFILFVTFIGIQSSSFSEPLKNKN
jgi:hypothetical protein